MRLPGSKDRRRKLRIAILIACLFATLGLVACESDTAPTSTAVPTATSISYVDVNTDLATFLRCEDCPAVDVIEVLNPETVVTSEGTFRLYGAFVAPEEENCAIEAQERLTELAGQRVRIESSTRATDSSGTPIRYLYTESGDSIDELLVSEGIARQSAFEGSHAPWLLVTADKTRKERIGCIWDNYNRLFPGRTPSASGR